MAEPSIDMNELQYNHQSLHEYLLGTLSEAETERFDESSFTDENFAAALKSAEQDLTDAYIQGELTGATLEKFEAHYLASPLRREKVEFARAFQVYAEKNIAPTSTKITPFVETEPKRNLTGFFSNIFTFSRPVLSFGAAFAALAIIFFGGWLWRESSRRQLDLSQANANREPIQQRETEIAKIETPSPVESVTPNLAVNSNAETESEIARAREERARLEKQTQERRRLAEQQKQIEQQRVAQNTPPVAPNQIGIAAFVLAPSLRGGSKIQSVSIPPRTGVVAVSLELETDEYTAYRAILRNPSDNRTLWSSGKIKSNKVGDGKRLKLNFPAALLKSGIYSIEVSGIAADGEAEIISDYSFRVMQ